MDTLTGLVAKQPSVKASESCVFKYVGGNSKTTYYAGNIFGYGFTGDRFFQSRPILVKDPLYLATFLEVVVKGRLNLYRLGKDFFLEKDTSGLHQLKDEAKKLMIDGDDYQKKENQHIGVMNMFMHDCPDVTKLIEETKLTRKSLAKLVEKYHQCKGDKSVTYPGGKPWARAMLGVVGGGGLSQPHFGSSPGYEHLAGDFEVSKVPTGGLWFDFASPRISERISLYGEVSYLHGRYYLYSFNRLPTTIRINYVSLDLPQVKMPVGLRYHFGGAGIKPFIGLGVSSTFHPRGNFTWVQEVEANAIVSRSENAAVAERKNQIGWWGSVGVIKPIHRKFALVAEVRYERTNGIRPVSIETSSISSSISNFQVLFGVRLR